MAATGGLNHLDNNTTIGSSRDWRIEFVRAIFWKQIQFKERSVVKLKHLSDTIVITDIAKPITVGICLIKIGYKREVINTIEHRVIVIIGITKITQAIAVSIKLIGISHKGSIINTVQHCIIVIIGIGIITNTITIGIYRLSCVKRKGIKSIYYAVVVIIRICIIANAVTIGICRLCWV